MKKETLGTVIFIIAALLLAYNVLGIMNPFIADHQEEVAKKYKKFEQY